MRNPCLRCAFADMDKNRQECVECPERVIYVRYLNGEDVSMNIQPLLRQGFGGQGKEINMGAIGEKKCGKCGDVKPLDTGFYKNDMCHDGYENICKACKSQAAKDRRIAKKLDDQEKRAAKRQAAEPIKPGPEKPKAPAGDGKVVSIDFSDYPEVYKGLEDLAKDRMRDLDKQVLFMIKQNIAVGFNKGAEDFS